MANGPMLTEEAVNTLLETQMKQDGTSTSPKYFDPVSKLNGAVRCPVVDDMDDGVETKIGSVTYFYSFNIPSKYQAGDLFFDMDIVKKAKERKTAGSLVLTFSYSTSTAATKGDSITVCIIASQSQSQGSLCTSLTLPANNSSVTWTIYQDEIDDLNDGHITGLSDFDQLECYGPSNKYQAQAQLQLTNNTSNSVTVRIVKHATTYSATLQVINDYSYTVTYNVEWSSGASYGNEVQAGKTSSFTVNMSSSSESGTVTFYNGNTHLIDEDWSGTFTSGKTTKIQIG